MAHIHLLVHVMHELVPKSALIVMTGRHVNKILSFIDCEYRDKMVSLPQSMDSNPSVTHCDEHSFQG
jgi:hypothetical protein